MVLDGAVQLLRSACSLPADVALTVSMHACMHRRHYCSEAVAAGCGVGVRGQWHGVCTGSL